MPVRLAPGRCSCPTWLLCAQGTCCTLRSQNQAAHRVAVTTDAQPCPPGAGRLPGLCSPDLTPSLTDVPSTLRPDSPATPSLRPVSQVALRSQHPPDGCQQRPERGLGGHEYILTQEAMGAAPAPAQLPAAPELRRDPQGTIGTSASGVWTLPLPEPVSGGPRGSKGLQHRAQGTPGAGAEEQSPRGEGGRTAGPAVFPVAELGARGWIPTRPCCWEPQEEGKKRGSRQRSGPAVPFPVCLYA